ncbi:MAG: hypothetical protein J0665_18035 [Deltaproteobacteria bacterium]|nr:hypothetical protein [Deltaproteobacteria bacterium]
MIDNQAFALTDEEFVRYNEWATRNATAMVDAEIESWTISVTFSFCNLGTDIAAHLDDATDNRGDLVIRSESY